MESTISQTVHQTLARGAGRRSHIAEIVLSRWLGGLEAGELTVTLPSGLPRTYSGHRAGPRADVRINRLRAISRILVSGDMGLAEGYIAGDWETPDLTSVLRLGVENEAAISGALRRPWWTAVAARLHHAGRANTRRGSRRNIAAHYDLGNDFYRHWLDSSMSYSSGLFASPGENHASAQRRKYLRLAHQLNLKPGERVLEIGCGWGGFAEMAAAEFGCHVTGLTLSTEQAAFARARMAKAGMADRVTIKLQDYRDVSGSFDKIVSIEMFEAVGEKNWPAYFSVLRDRLKPGGHAALQVITIGDDSFEGYRRNPDFIQRYIFPGGMLPSPAKFGEAAHAGGFLIQDAFAFGPSYAESLRRWRNAFLDNWPRIQQFGFDRRFHRLWQYYLSYCEAGFQGGKTDVYQYVLARR